MKKFVIYTLWISLLACDFIETEKVSSEEILSAETKELNWQEVDQYPAFGECREILDSEKARKCFRNRVASFIYARLEAKRPVVTKSLNDTLYIHLRISENGQPSIDSVDVSPSVTTQLPKIRTWLSNSIDSLPKIYPATKRGIPVVTTFKMPLVIKAE